MQRRTGLGCSEVTGPKSPNIKVGADADEEDYIIYLQDSPFVMFSTN